MLRHRFSTDLPRRACTLLAIAAAGWCAAPALAEPDGGKLEIGTIDLESLLDSTVYAASRHEELASAAPASVFVVTAADIRRQGFRSLDEILRSVPGLVVSNDSACIEVGVRGLGILGDMNTRVLFLIDGHPINNSVAIGQSYIARDLPVDVRALERVEVIKGPAGGVYGPTAFFGVINLVTRNEDFEGGEVGLAADAMQSRFTGGEASAVFGQRLGKLHVFANVGVFRSRGFDFAYPELAITGDRPVPELGAVPGTDGLASENAYLRARYGEWALSAGYDQRVKGLSTAPYSAVIGDPRNADTNRTMFADLSWERRVDDDLTLLARASFDDFLFADTLVYPDHGSDDLFQDHGADHWWTAELRATLTPGEAHRTTLGATIESHQTEQLSHVHDQPSLHEDPVDGVGVGAIRRSFHTVNAYVLSEHRLGTSLQLQGGATFNAHELFGSRFTPKIAAVWQPSREDTLRFNYSHGFRPPTMYEAYFEDGVDFIANPRLSSELAVAYELGYQRRLFNAATLSATVYQGHYLNLIRYEQVPAPDLRRAPDPDQPGDFRQQARNASRITARGLELGVSVRTLALEAYAGVAAQEAVFLDTSDANFAPLTANFALSSNALWSPLELSLNGAFVSARSTEASLLLPGQPESVAPYLWLNTSARFEVPSVRGLTAQLTVTNLLDAEVMNPVPGDFSPLVAVREHGRSVRMSVEYRF